MDLTSYKFQSVWHIDASPKEIYNIISNSSQLTRWWPSVYLEVNIIEPGLENGLGKILALHTKGWLPYSLRWNLKVKNTDKPKIIEIEAFGDLQGNGKWTFQNDGSYTKVIYDWEIMANKPLLRYLSWLLKPAFKANHAWAMKKGEESLKLEVRRRRGEENVPEPPGAILLG